jgi:hypothetical protein
MSPDKQIPSISAELNSVNLPDARLVKRTEKVIKALEENPDASFPDAFENPSELTGAYRLLNNPAASPEALLAPHMEATAERCRAVGSVLILHDSSKLIFSEANPRKDLYKLSSRQFGYMTHALLALSADGLRCPLGITALESFDPNVCQGLTRSERDVHPQRPQLRWIRGVEKTKRLLGDDVERIHVADRELDGYERMAEIVGLDEQFIVRMCYDRQNTRPVDQEDGDELISLCEATAGQPIMMRRTVELSERKHPAGSPPRKYKKHPEREARQAELTMRVRRVEIPRPASVSDTLPDSLEVAVVHVLEENPPADCEPVEWFLLTTLELRTPEQVEFVVDSYVARWLIEELFKGLKTGCRIEDRQLQSLQACRTAEALMMPIAYKMLMMRHLSRQARSIPARAVLTESQEQVLRKISASKKRKLPSRLTAKRALKAIALLGGHANPHQPFGWLVLYRGWRKVIETEAAWQLMRS